ncbi:MAG: PEP-CTERM sorting domain-containing protein [Nanoarchaeota archaeon]|nr:PEP-CTERM sorting domain-containing protein [Nanoarchaeota archaeon]
MNNKKLNLAMMLLSGVLGSQSANATYISDNYIGANGENPSSVDVYGSSLYDVKGVDVNLSSNNILNMHFDSPFTERKSGYSLGDLFLSTDGWTPFGNSPYGSDNMNNGETWEAIFDSSEGNLYANTGINPFVIKTSSYRKNHEVSRMSGGNLISGTNNFINFNDDNDPATSGLLFQIDLENLRNFFGNEWRDNGFGFHFSPASCGNDVIEGYTTWDEPSKVPEPATLGLLGLGLAGVAFRRRQSKIQNKE